MRVRSFEGRDQAAVRRMIQNGLRERWGADFDEGANPDTDDLEERYTTDGNQLVVAVSDGDVIVGCGALIVHAPGRARMVRVSVSAQHRRRGIARSVVQELVERARLAGNHTLHVSTDTPWVEAVELYRSCGFTEVGQDDVDTYFELDLRDVRLTFDQVPELYTSVRPSYPDELFDRLFAMLSPQPQVLEVGPGTGQATASLLDRGAHVTAVEFGPNLAAELRARFTGHERLQVVTGAFETADLALGHFDAVVSATAYHWIEAERQISRPHELLRSGGVLAVVDLIQVGSPVDGGYFDRVQPIYEHFGDHRHDWSPPSYDSAMPAMAAQLQTSRAFDAVDVARVRWDQTYTAAQYRDLLLTYSGTRMMNPGERHDMVDQLVSVVADEFDGSITRPLVATLTTGRARV